MRNDQLTIERKSAPTISTPLREVAVLVLGQAQITCTQAVLSGVVERGGAVLTCNEQHLPCGMMLPINSHSTQASRFAAQAGASKPIKKRLWRQIVRAKIRAQAATLVSLRGDDYGLTELIRTVRSGDPNNVEARAAVRYWPALFDDPQFRRRRFGQDQNRYLNYGYAVLRAIVGRAVCAVGLHPSLGLHHHNQYNAFCLADDLMEPYRPVVDAAVVEVVGTYGSDMSMDRSVKYMLLEPLTGRFPADGQMRMLFDVVAQTASSLVRVLTGRADKLWFPEALCDGNA